MPDERLDIEKGGSCWLQMTLDRRGGGLDVWLKADPRLEEFISGLSKERKAYPIEKFGRGWQAIAGEELRVYNFDTEDAAQVTGDGWTLGGVGEKLVIPGKLAMVTNLSFLRLKGISDGVRFRMQGPFAKPVVSEYARSAMKAVEQLLRNHVVPSRISIRVSSQEL